jgi:hypothetical protein
MHKCLRGNAHKSTLKLGRVCAYIVREKIAITVDSFADYHYSLFNTTVITLLVRVSKYPDLHHLQCKTAKSTLKSAKVEVVIEMTAIVILLAVFKNRW